MLSEINININDSIYNAEYDMFTVYLAENVKICHGDFNLDNIMVDEEDNLKLVDFGKGCFLDNNSKKKYRH